MKRSIMAQENTSKNRKSESQEIYDQADNAGRFAGDDADAKAARENLTEQIRQDSSSNRSERDNPAENTDAEARRNPSQTNDYKGEAQNVEDDNSSRLEGEEAQKAGNKATEGIRQGRDED